jgi:hydrogenase/urease accessory protein HupE
MTFTSMMLPLLAGVCRRRPAYPSLVVGIRPMNRPAPTRRALRRALAVAVVAWLATSWAGQALAHTGGSTAYADIVVSERAVRFKVSLPTATLPETLRPESDSPSPGASVGSGASSAASPAAVAGPSGAPAGALPATSEPATPAPPTSSAPATPASPTLAPRPSEPATPAPPDGAAGPAASPGSSGQPPTAAGTAPPPGRAATSLLAAVRDAISVSRDGERCAPGPGTVQGIDTAAHTITLVVEYDCHEPIRRLVVRDGLFEVLGKDHLCLAKVEFPGGMQQFAFAADNRELRLGLGKEDAAPGGALSFLALGVEHILTGWDHLLFLLALMLCGGNLWSLFKIVTAFTLAHSITLALAALDVVNLPSRWVEAAIAASIAYVAAENLFLGGRISRRWMVSFVFGLVHGFGFSAALRELDLNRSGLVLSLLNFNLGVELGQAVVVAATVPFLLKLRRTAWEPRVVRALSTATLLVGLALFVERAFF